MRKAQVEDRIGENGILVQQSRGMAPRQSGGSVEPYVIELELRGLWKVRRKSTQSHSSPLASLPRQHQDLLASLEPRGYGICVLYQVCKIRSSLLRKDSCGGGTRTAAGTGGSRSGGTCGGTCGSCAHALVKRPASSSSARLGSRKLIGHLRNTDHQGLFNFPQTRDFLRVLLEDCGLGSFHRKGPLCSVGLQLY